MLPVRAVPLAALVSYLTALTICFGLRPLILRARTGTSGFRGISGPPGSASWWAGISFVLALAAGVAAPAAHTVGGTTAPDALTGPGVWIPGAVLAGVGTIGVLAAQQAMGASWRIGVDPDEHTTLVTHGVFAHIRNPVFTAMITASIGWALMVPSWLSVSAVAVLVLAAQLQVRIVEEPYLKATHPQDYPPYARRVGRFLPHL